ncbi:MAG: hypothetical protein K0S76_938 [Herbinix sp.]|jgi:N-acetylmuramoyl-L-alanine amidase|nr:hypothetical protein [Herbinix sp.]
MDISLLKRTAMQSVALMLAVITLSYALQQYHAVIISASNMEASETSINSEAEKEASDTDLINTEQADVGAGGNGLLPSVSIPELKGPAILKLMKGINPEMLKQLGDKYLVIKKPSGVNTTYHLEDLYITKSIKITLTGLHAEDMTSEMIGRANKEESFAGESKYTETIIPDPDTTDDSDDSEIVRDYGNDIVHGIIITHALNDEQKNYSAELLIQLDDVYVHTMYEDEAYYYIDLKDPKDVYDKILVIDAGHGGKDAGALSQGEKYYEKNINLDILLNLKELLDKEDIKVYYTRTGDDKVFLKPREELANAVDCDFFISIHCNASVASWPNGTEIYYYDTETKGVKNKDLAKLFLDEITKATPLKKREIVKKVKDEIYILKKAEVPAILIEVGYVTNNNDMKYLSGKENRKEVAQGIYNAIREAYERFQSEDDRQ